MPIFYTCTKILFPWLLKIHSIGSELLKGKGLQFTKYGRANIITLFCVDVYTTTHYSDLLR